MAHTLITRDGTEILLQVLDVPAANASLYLVVSKQKRDRDASTSIFVAPEEDIKAMLREKAGVHQSHPSPNGWTSKVVSQTGNSISEPHRGDDLAATSLSTNTGTTSSTFAMSSSSSSGSSTISEGRGPTTPAANVQRKRKNDDSDTDSSAPSQKKNGSKRQTPDVSSSMMDLAGEQQRHSDAVFVRPKTRHNPDLQPPRHSQSRSATDDANSKKSPLFDGTVAGTILCEQNPTVHEHPWEAHFQRLCAYVDQFGDCLVPHNSKNHPILAQWVKRQRHQYKLRMRGDRSTMTDYRIQKLDSVGFVWQAQAASWYERYKDLKEFHGKFGHCRVPTRYAPNKALGAWVKCQRAQYRKRQKEEHNNMTPERIENLVKLDFSWEIL